MTEKVNVIILAAGKGTRLRPYTADRPKCMVELCGRPMLHRQLDVLRIAGLKNIALVSGYRADRLHVRGITVVENPRYATTNMVTTLFCAESQMNPGEDLIVAYGDIVYEPRVLEAVLQSRAPLAIAVDRQWRRLWEARMEEPLEDAETLKLLEGDRIVELGKKPEGYEDVQGQYMGLIKVRGDQVRAFLDAWHAMDRDALYDGKDFDNMYMTSFLQHLIDSGWDARAAFTDGGWVEIDTAEELELFSALQQQGKLTELIRLD